MYQKITIAGNLGSDPEMKYMNDGNAVTNFNVAVSDGYGENKRTIWFRVSVWGKRAEAANQYLSKGSKILVEGRLKVDPNTGAPRTFQKKDNTVGVSLEIAASDFVFLSSRGDMEAAAGQDHEGGAPAPAYAPKAGSLTEDDDMPF
jgi:single-strand DNA-binding protein